MNKKLTQLAIRRKYLVSEAASQRTAFAQILAPWHAPLGVVDKGLCAIRYIKEHPVFLAGVTALLTVFRPKRTGKWLSRGLILWQLGRKFLRN